MTQFAQPWSMDCSYKQALEVKPLLEEMGYEVKALDKEIKFSILVSNWSDIKSVSNLKSRYRGYYNRLYLGSFHKELLLAIAAMRTDGWHKGEAVINLHATGRHPGQLDFIQNEAEFSKSKGHAVFRKATAQEIIDYYRNGKRVFDVEVPAQGKVEDDTKHDWEEPNIPVELLEVSVKIQGNVYVLGSKGVQVLNHEPFHSDEALEAAIREYRKYFNQ